MMFSICLLTKMEKDYFYRIFNFIVKNDRMVMVNIMGRKSNEQKVREALEEEEKKKGNIVVRILYELFPYVVILVLVVIVRTFFFTPILVSGPSMQPTLYGGELMILNKMAKIDRFDIVVVNIEKEDIIKRVIALPGETVSCERGNVYVNGRKLEEEYSKGSVGDCKKITLADDEYFVLGDNREDSLDSEELGPMKRKQIMGTTNFILLPIDRVGKVNK